MHDDTVAEAAIADQSEGGVVAGFGGQSRSGPTIDARAARDSLTATLLALESWGARRDWRGTDPYEGMNARRLARLKRTALGRRMLIQLVKRSPIDLRRPLGIESRHNAAAAAHVLSAYTRLEALESATLRVRIDQAVERLLKLRTPGYDEPCWGYHFDVETRFFFYASTTPNTIASSFGGRALLDAFEATGRSELLELAEGVGDFLRNRIELTAAGTGAYLGYFPGDSTPIHNANLLACALLAELSGRCARPEFAEIARAGVRYALAHQRGDGSWPYAEVPAGDWVDNFHTGYVLDALLRCELALDDPGISASRRRGLTYYIERLFLPDATPRYFDHRTEPIDTQCVAQAIDTFTLAATAPGASADPGLLRLAWRVYDFGARRMRRPDGAFIFQRRRLWVNRTPHMRWVQAPMFDALSRLDAAGPPARDAER